MVSPVAGSSRTTSWSSSLVSSHRSQGNEYFSFVSVFMIVAWRGVTKWRRKEALRLNITVVFIFQFTTCVFRVFNFDYFLPLFLSFGFVSVSGLVEDSLYSVLYSVLTQVQLHKPCNNLGQHAHTML